MTNHFTEKAQCALKSALEISCELGHTYIGSEHILLGLMRESDCTAAKFLESKGLTYGRLRDAVAEFAGIGVRSRVSPSDMTPRTKKIIEASSEKSKRSGTQIGTEHILQSLLDERNCVAVRLLTTLGINISELKNDVSLFLDKGVFTARRTPMKADRLAGLTHLPLYGRDMTALARAGRLDPIIGREKETERVIQILSRRTKNNPCLIGEPGVGKTAVVEGLCTRIANGSVPDNLRDRAIVSLDIASMVAGAKYRGEFEERLKGVMEEVRNNPSLILFIDELHTIVGAGAAEGAVDAANILKPVLARGGMQLIGATTTEEYRKHIEHDAALERRFQSVAIDEPSPIDAMNILRGLRPKYEEHHGLKISDDAIEAAVELSVRYITDRYLPDKAIDLIDEAAAKLRLQSCASPLELNELEAQLREAEESKRTAIQNQNFDAAAAARDMECTLRKKYEDSRREYEAKRSEKELCVHAEDIALTVTQWTGIPVSACARGQKNIEGLSDELKAHVIGQNEAVEALTRTIMRGRAGISDPKRPIGSFIFLGPTGVGKTELAKALARAMFGSEDALIRIDMSEYSEKHSVSRLVGSPPGYVGYEDGGQLTERVRRKPYSVVLFDEIEKAHPDFTNIMLQILDDGHLTDSTGRTVNFKNTIIVMTSNLGSGVSSPNMLGFSDKKETRDDASRRRIIDSLKDRYAPEFINRIDEIIVFRSLDEETLEKIARKVLAELADRLLSLGILAEFDQSVVQLLLGDKSDRAYGARPIKRRAAKLVEDLISSEIIKGKITADDNIKLYAEGDEVKIHKLASKRTAKK